MKWRYLLFSIVIFSGVNSCKKESTAPAPAVTIVGKWFITKQASELFSPAGVQVYGFTNSKFSANDFVEYFMDGTGYYSKDSTPAPSLSEFQYTLSGTTITQYTSVNNAGTPETITGLTLNALSIHVVSAVSDPNDPTITDKEIDDFTYSK